MCIVRERRPAGFLDMKCQTCFSDTVLVNSLIQGSQHMPMYRYFYNVSTFKPCTHSQLMHVHIYMMVYRNLKNNLE